MKNLYYVSETEKNKLVIYINSSNQGDILLSQGVSSPSQCERIALLLHYTHVCCAMWIVTLAAAVAEYCACDTLLPLKYNYLLAYGVPAIVVMVSRR